MQGLGDWILTNSNAISGYIILIVGVVAFIWAISTGKLVSGKDYDRVNTALANCLHELNTPGGAP
jgi:hypothetical protein